MENEHKTLQLFYASVLADSVNHYNQAGILDMVTEKKAAQQEITAAPQLKQLGIESPEQLFDYYSRVFGCIRWQVAEENGAVTATGNHCLLCSIAKKMQTAQPCHIYCINPIRAMLKSMDPSFRLSVEETLWEGSRCVFRSTRTGKITEE
jgi:hypothetical protein